MKNILVTGGAGFIGSHTVDRLLEKGYMVTVLDDLRSGHMNNLPLKNTNLKFVKGDIRDNTVVDELLSGCDGVVHLAAQVSVSVSIQDPILSNDINIRGFLNILDGVKKHDIKSMVYASSAAVYGLPETTNPLKEDAQTMPISPYGLEKLINDKYADLYSQLYGTKAAGMRFFNVYGPRQDPSSQYSGVISIFASKLSANEPITIYGDGEQTRDFIFVKDVADSIILALESSASGIYNVATGNSITLNNLVQTLTGALGSKADISYGEPRSGDIKVSAANNEKLRTGLSKTSFVSLDKGLAELLASLR